MGTMHHHAIIVTGWDEKSVGAAHLAARELFGWVSEVSPEVTNGYRSFFIPPDGSKEGWPESDRGNYCRQRFFAYIQEMRGQDLHIHAIEVEYGELGIGAKDPLTRDGL